MKFILSSPSSDDLIRLLRAWRFWLVGAVAGALIGAAFFYLLPPPFRARATVNVDFHMEQAWPQNSPSEQFYYLERETRKLEEIATSDSVLNLVASQVSGVTVEELRAQKLQLSQPGNGGWHFYADDPDAQKSQALVSAWAQVFAQNVQSQMTDPSSSLEKYITAVPSQTQHLAPQRSVSLSKYLLIGSVAFLALSALLVLFVDVRK